MGNFFSWLTIRLFYVFNFAAAVGFVKGLHFALKSMDHYLGE